MKQKTPQEKKFLSYKKDCRNTYGENDKRSRKAIPKRKAQVNRVYRRKFAETLKRIGSINEPSLADDIEVRARNLKRVAWKKIADTPLGEVVESKLARRINHAGHGKTARKRMREFAEGLRIETEQETAGRWIAEAIDLNGVLVYGKTEEIAISSCLTLAGFVFGEEIGAVRILEVNDHYISVETK